MYNGSILRDTMHVQWTNPTMHVQRTNPMGTQCVCKGSIYGNAMHVQRITEHQSYRQCMYLRVNTVSHVSHVRKASYKEFNMPTCTE